MAQMVQTKGFSPVCILMCSSRLLLSLQAFSHNGHMKLEVLVCVVTCALRVDLNQNEK